MKPYPAVPGWKLIRFVFSETDRSLRRVVGFAVISGIAGALVLAAINHGAQVVGQSTEVQPLILFIGLLALFLYSKRYSLVNAVMAVEEMLESVRNRIAKKIAVSELESIEKIGPSYIFNRLSQDTVLISDSAHVIFASFGALILLIFAIIYIAVISFEGFAMTLIAVSLGIIVFLSKRREIIDSVRQATKMEVEFLGSIEQSLGGFKEIKLNQNKAKDLLREQQIIGAELTKQKKRSGRSQTFVMMFSQGFFYTLLGVVVFVWPVVMNEPVEIVIKVSAAILFIIGPLDLVVGSMPLFMEADVAVENLIQLEKRLEENKKKNGDSAYKPIEVTEFPGIRLDGVQYDYVNSEDESGFNLGPIDLHVNPGEVLFIVGGNGSGKSTLLKVLTGLYYPTKGAISLGDKILKESDYHAYRQNFSAIFTDFFLFNELYGIPSRMYDQASDLLDFLEISQKTDFVDGRFTNQNLSTGQRKRLALIASMLEERSVFIFDEIAADQDPSFRRKFYQEVIPKIQENGNTIIAVTHDDRYFDAADRYVVMEDGKITT